MVLSELWNLDSCVDVCLFAKGSFGPRASPCHDDEAEGSF